MFVGRAHRDILSTTFSARPGSKNENRFILFVRRGKHSGIGDN